MAVYEIFTHSELRRYKAHICSKATIINILCLLLTFVPPLFIAYRSEGFWKKIEFYEEQPDVEFKHKIIVILETKETFITWSTYQNFNDLQTDHFRIPIIKSREEDVNRDGFYDMLHFDMTMPLSDKEKITGFTLLLFFDYRLHKYVELEMESLGSIQFQSAAPGTKLSYLGDLSFQQINGLPHRGIDQRYQGDIFNPSTVDSNDMDLFNIVTQYSKRNVTTKLTNAYTTWSNGVTSGDNFQLEVKIRYPTTLLYYSPGFWQLIKLAWIQYLSILIIFIFFINRIKLFIFQNQLVSTIMQRPWKNAT